MPVFSPPYAVSDAPTDTPSISPPFSGTATTAEKATSDKTTGDVTVAISTRVNTTLGLAAAATGARPFLKNCFERDQKAPTQAYTFRFLYHYDFNVVVEVGVVFGLPSSKLKILGRALPVPGIRGAATGLAVAKATAEVIEASSGAAVGSEFKNLYANYKLFFDVNENVKSVAEALAVTVTLDQTKEYFWQFTFSAAVGIGSTGIAVNGGSSIIGSTTLDAVAAQPDVFPTNC